MRSRRLGLLLVTSSAALSLAACSSSTSGVGGSGSPAARTGTASTAGGSAAASSGSASTGSASSASSGGAAPAKADNPEALAALLQQGLASTTSARIDLSVTTAGKTITGNGVERLAAGRTSALDLSETIPEVGTLRLIQVNGMTYAKLPAKLTSTGKPWTLVTTSSTNPTIKALAGSLASSQSSASVGSAGVFAKAAASIKNRGATTVDGMTATHYSVVVETSKLPTTYPGREALLQAGVTTLPVELYVDGQGRPVRVTEQLTVSGMSVSTAFTVSKYNQPVTITAPPATQVGR